MYKEAPVLVLGCAHAGLLNILNHIESELGINKLSAIIGGTHLMYTQSDFMPEIIDKIESFDVDIVATSHCTGFEPAATLAHHFKERYIRAGAGCEISI